MEGTTYVFATGFFDNGVSVFGLDANGVLTNVFNVDDAQNVNFQLASAQDPVIAQIGGQTFLFVSGDSEGISVFSVGADGSLTNVDNVADVGNILFNQLLSLATATIGTDTILYAGGVGGVTDFVVDPDTGELTFFGELGAIPQFDDVSALHTASVGGTPFLFDARACSTSATLSLTSATIPTMPSTAVSGSSPA